MLFNTICKIWVEDLVIIPFIKWISGAFDRISQDSIIRFINSTEMAPKLKQILIKLFTDQQVAIQLGARQSKFMKIQRGIIQGSVLSPMLFTSIVHAAVKHLYTNEFKMIWYANDLLILAPKNKINDIISQISDALGTIGLSFNNAKTREITDRSCTYLGFVINNCGIERDKQFEYNIKKAKATMSSLTFSGVFKKSVKEDHLVHAFGSNVLAILEYGMGLIKPTADSAQRVRPPCSRIWIQCSPYTRIWNRPHQTNC